MGQSARVPKKLDPWLDASSPTNSSIEDVRVTPRLTVVLPAQPTVTRRHRRRWFSVVHPLQVRIVSHVIAYSLIIFLLPAILIAPSLMGILNNPTQAWHERATAANNLLSRSWPWVLGVGLVALIHGIHSVRVMHRVTGPLYRLKQACLHISNGNLCTRTTLREGDYLHPESDLINRMTTQLEIKIMALKHTQVMLALDVTRIKERAIATGDPTLTVLTRQMEQNLAGLKSSFDSFKTHSGPTTNREA